MAGRFSRAGVEHQTFLVLFAEVAVTAIRKRVL